MKLTFQKLMFGCDPEFFFRTGRTVVGADRVLPLSGLAVSEDVGNSVSKVIIDGVQAELNPQADFEIREVGMNIAYLFALLGKHIKQFKNLNVDFSRTIRLSDKEFARLSPDSKKFGCSPSKNTSLGGKDGAITIDPAIYRYRSAGGHIHIGVPDNAPPEIENTLKDPVLQLRLVAMLDLLVGNTCVLIDRDSGNIERRKVYGKAGEYRTPKHGLEYRTPSNFWLQNYTLMDMVMELCRLSVIIVSQNQDKEFTKLVSAESVAEAINTNSFPIALQNFKAIEKKLLEITPVDPAFPINSGTIDDFYYFIRMGTRNLFAGDPVRHWAGLLNGEAMFSLYDLLTMTVRKARIENK